MARSFPPRPEHDFRITCFAWQLDNEANHRRAGFPVVPEETLIRRFWQYLSFLQAQGLTVRVIAESSEDICLETTLRNSDLTDEGYRFAQRFGDRWSSRVYKDTGEASEAKYLIKWLNQLRADSVGP